MNTDTISKPTEKINFLKSSISEDLHMQIMRKRIQNIVDDYNGPMDLLAELSQNGLDAIQQNNLYPSHFEIIINKKKESVEVKDTGTGITKELLEKVFAPDFSTKNNSKFRGEKGVGLTFIIFSTNCFQFETDDGNKKVMGEILDANNWLSNGGEPPFIQIKSESPSTGVKFTKFILSKLVFPSREEDNNFFDYDNNKLIVELRTHTAVGSLESLFSSKEEESKKIWQDSSKKMDNISISLEVIEVDGTLNKISILSKFETFLTEECISIEERKSIRLEKKENKHFGKPTYLIKRFTKNGINMDVFFLFAKASFFEGKKRGIFAGKKYMPTTIKIDWMPGKEGYIKNIFAMVHCDNFPFDTGRKSVSGKQVGNVRVFLNSIFNEDFEPYLTDIMGQNDDEVQESKLEGAQKIEDTWDFVMQKKDLQILQLPNFIKKPAEEQDVVALFHELVGAGLISGYLNYGNFSNKQYDSFCMIQKEGKRPLKIIQEYKYHAVDLIKEVSGAKPIKDFSKINILICWDLGDESFLDSGNYSLEKQIKKHNLYDGVTHTLFNGTHNISVICLESFMDKLKKE